MKIISNFKELEKNDQIIFFLFITVIVNVIMAIIKFVFSLTIPSLWFFINAIFSIILALLRIFSIKDYRKMRYEQDIIIKKKIGLKNYLNNGILLILLGIAYFSVSIYMYYRGTNTNMHEYLTYLVALIAFYSIGSSIYGMIKYRKNHNPILKAVKVTNFANALTSIVLTQVVLLDTFNSEVDVRVANGLVGILVSIIIIVLGLYMIFGIKEFVNNE